jgi:hypothetical protein
MYDYSGILDLLLLCQDTNGVFAWQIFFGGNATAAK